jgi:A/G-specific adenine glycosylase
MLQRTKAEQVLPAYLSFCAEYDTPEDYLNKNNKNVFETLGLQQREKELKSLARMLIKEDIPKDKDMILKMPGVGEYIASAYCSLHLGVRSSIIDSNVVRLYGRYFGFETDGETRRKKWFIEIAEKLTPIKKYGGLDFKVVQLDNKFSVDFGYEPTYQYEELFICHIENDKDKCRIKKGKAQGVYGSNIETTCNTSYSELNCEFKDFIDKWHDRLINSVQ